jgi:transposase
MKLIRDKVAGLDIHRDTVVACCRFHHQGRRVALTMGTFATTTKGLKQLVDWLSEASVTAIAMEATGVYWNPVYRSLQGHFEEFWLCNAQHVKNVPGRKTDLNDAEWLADVASHGMVRPSFIPPTEIRQLRELTRYRKTQVDAQPADPASGEGDPRRRHQAQFGGVGRVVEVSQGDHRGSDRGRARSGGSRPDGQESDAREDPPT